VWICVYMCVYVWMCGYVDVWICGYVDVWMCGEVDMWKWVGSESGSGVLVRG
jgi:hypothetical protein